MSGRLGNKVAVITGAASGFGAVTARRFVAEGASVVLGDIQDEPLQRLRTELGEAAVAQRCDVTQENDVAALIDLAVETFGRLDVMFNNAGIVGAVGPIATTPLPEWRATLAVDLDGVFFGMKHAARHMVPQGSGSIISVSSVAGILGGLGPHAYTAAKHAVIGLTKSVAAELGRHGVRVNAIAPGSMATPMVADVRTGDPTAVAETVRLLAETSPLAGRVGLPEDVANVCLWLASDESGYTTGLVLTTDGGLCAGATLGTSSRPEYAPMIREAGGRGLAPVDESRQDEAD